MDHNSAPSRLTVNRRPMSAGQWSTTAVVERGVRHGSAQPYRRPTRPTDEVSAAKVRNL